MCMWVKFFVSQCVCVRVLDWRKEYRANRMTHQTSYTTITLSTTQYTAYVTHTYLLFEYQKDHWVRQTRNWSVRILILYVWGRRRWGGVCFSTRLCALEVLHGYLPPVLFDRSGRCALLLLLSIRMLWRRVCGCVCVWVCVCVCLCVSVSVYVGQSVCVCMGGYEEERRRVIGQMVNRRASKQAAS